MKSKLRLYIYIYNLQTDVFFYFLCAAWKWASINSKYQPTRINKTFSNIG